MGNKDKAKKAAAAVVVPVVMSPEEAMAGIRNLFDTLIPPEVVLIKDAFGGVHTARDHTPGKAQITVMREMQKIFDKGISAADMKTAMADGSMGAIIPVIVRMALEEDVLKGIEKAFIAAHGWIMKAAIVNRDNMVGEDEQLANPTPTDLFSLEEVLASLVPFFVKFVARTGDLITSLTVAPTTVEPAEA